MSVEAMTWAYTVPLPPCPKSILVALANRADQDGYCWPGLEDLEARTGWNRRSIQRGVKELEASGLLDVSPRFTSNGVQTSNLYRLSMTPISCGEGVSPSPPQGVCVSPPGRLCVTPRVTVCHPNLHLNNQLNNQLNTPPFPPNVGKWRVWCLHTRKTLNRSGSCIRIRSGRKMPGGRGRRRGISQGLKSC